MVHDIQLKTILFPYMCCSYYRNCLRCSCSFWLLLSNFYLVKLLCFPLCNSMDKLQNPFSILSISFACISLWYLIQTCLLNINVCSFSKWHLIVHAIAKFNSWTGLVNFWYVVWLIQMPGFIPLKYNFGLFCCQFYFFLMQMLSMIACVIINPTYKEVKILC